MRRPIALNLDSKLEDTEQEFSFNDYTEDSAELKTDLPEIIGTVNDSRNTVSFHRLHEVHGSFEPNPNKGATLLVLRVIPKAKNGRPFKYFRAQLTLYNIVRSGDEPPSIFGYGPAQQGIQYIDEFYKKVAKESSIHRSLTAEPFGGGLSTSASKTSKEECQSRKLHTLEAGTDNSDMRSRNQNVVWWEVKAAEESNGIGDQLDIAVLIKRARRTKFFVRAETKAGFVGFSLKDMKLSLQKQKCIEFGPFDPACESRITSQRAMRHRKMAALYSSLAQLHWEEADEVLVLNEAEYVNQIEQNEASFAAGMKNEQGDTPLHLAMKLGKGSPTSRWPPLKSSQESNMSRPRSVNSSYELNDIFDASRLLQERKEKYEDDKKRMIKLLTITNNAGQSPYQTRVVHGDPENDKEEIAFQTELKQLIFDTLDDIPDVSKAIYGTQEKELCLDTSDFNQRTHDFTKFVEKLIEINSVEFKFEETLFFAHLPDLNSIRKPCPYEGVRPLVNWLQKNGERRIKTLSMRDNTTTPMSDALVEEGIIQKFEIEKLDWHIARVGKGHKNILLENAVKAIHWALEQQVDIISMSWTVKEDHEGLKKAVQDAVRQTESTHPTLLFCSTADEELYSGAIWPADYENTVKVAATDQHGHIRPTSTSVVEIIVPGEDIVADGPSYMDRYILKGQSLDRQLPPR
ncbi:hypothetical protein EYC80_004542 [Monilinia laxa]|uniref:Peptidase S8/S53 domain-containing protein n=1 Tax=Monilinia laxa TaxID=61186 RepID=A0A5N6KIL5_MONLA|nr:hypothetical protein EYC80_004542 [Monilinia laxa]